LMFTRIGQKCDARNTRSRAAILRLESFEEGMPRRKMVMYGDFIRHTAYFILVAARQQPARTGRALRPAGTSAF
jgi:RimJ/RimL family protein N-acetyltransferase